MSHRFGGAVLASLLVIPPSGGSGQEPTPPTFKVGTAVVTLDLVVHDKRGRRVADLRAEEIEIQEDGVKREITSFRFVERAAAAKEVVPAPTVEAKAPSGDEALRLVEVPTAQRGGWRVEAEFVGAIRGEEKVRLNDFATGVRYMEFTEAVARSAALNLPIDLPLKTLG
jgi:hypothetical protein